MNKTLLAFFTALFTVATALPAMADLTSHYQGKIGDHLAVNLQLTSTGEGKYTGIYRYANHGQILSLQQTSEKNGEYTFRETAWRDDKVSGILRGKFQDDRNTFAGTWQSADGKRSLPFTLQRVADTVEFVSAQTDRYEVRVAYPKFPADSAFHKALNAEVRKQAETEFDQTVKEYREDTAKPEDVGSTPYFFTTDVEVIQSADTLVSILYGQSYYTGGAHPNTNFTCANYVWRDGKLVNLDFSQIVKGDAGTIKKLNTLCVKRLKEQQASLADDIKFSPKYSPVTNLTPGGLIFTFAPYEAGCYAEGIYSVFIKFSEFGQELSATSLEK